MKKFRYRAKTSEGKTVEGLVEANTDSGAVATLRARNLIIISLNELGNSPMNSFLLLFQRLSFSDVVEFTRQLATMISAGLPLTDALDSLRSQSKPAMAKVLGEILNDIRAGGSLHESLAKHPKIFPKIYLALVKSGETAGTLDDVLRKLADNMEKQQGFASRVKSAMIYPIIVMVAMIAVAFLMMTLVIPKLMGMYTELGADLPLPTKVLIAVSTFFAQFWWLVLGIVFGGSYGFNIWHQTDEGRHVVDGFWFKIPLIGNLQEKVILTGITRTLAMLITTGVSIIESLNIVAESADNVIIEEAIKTSAKEVEKGIPLSVSFSRYDFFPPIVSQMIAVGEETGKLNEVLDRVSAHFEEESDLAIKTLTASIEPIMIIILGIGVGFLVMGIIFPIYNLTSKF